MISFTVRMRFKGEERQQVDEMLRELALASRKEPGCVTYVPHRVDGDPDSVVIYEQYHDQAALDAHRATEHFHKYAVGGIFQMMRDRQLENFITLI
ncbi:putative quinol monooxygenase [Paracidobacterium acidisoli]|uniref:Antibiotic biosynthesis monooxygenase n=1 Tax=Paracidobacterium acidisoli TaxID=2303751 RepID=A0A372IN68_9BACT|nr:putative quinol monooxygenase [Paracidobacterium acidisoli]MBT9331649.1 antibiotic biosynthesis monooxygenase [Paracidobacterium acidisoli]